jgi:hypothetical protein
MNIRSVHADLVTRLATLEITAPVPATIKKVFKYVPALSKSITDYPCIFLTYELTQVWFRPSFLEQEYTVHIQLFAGRIETEQDVAADIASAFLDALVTKLSTSQRLGNTVSVIRGLRGAAPDTLTGLQWAGVGFVGLDLFLDVTLKTTAVHAA